MSQDNDQLIECAEREIERADKEGYDPTAEGPRFGFLGTAGNAILVLVALIATFAFVRSCLP